MAIRDIGYRPYDGPRLPPTNNIWVMLQHGIRRAFASWLVKLVIFFGWIPGAIGVAAVFFVAQTPKGDAMPVLFSSVSPAELCFYMLGIQMWATIAPISLGAGANAISEDLSFHAIHFYFSKPVTPEQYLFGRIAAIAIIIFGFAFLPAAGVIAAFLTKANESHFAEIAGLTMPSLLGSLLLAIVFSTLSVAISATNRSRALTMTSWVFLLLVPPTLAAIAGAISDTMWLDYISIPALFDAIGRSIFKMDLENTMPWWHAAAVLSFLSIAAVIYARIRLRSAESIS